MRRSLTATAFAAACLGLMLVAPGGATAAPKIVHHGASFSFEAHLPSADGYALYLRAKNHRDIELDVERESFAEPYVTMTYRVRGRVGDDGIKGDLGRFGDVDLRVVGHPRVERFRHTNCTPKAPTISHEEVLRGRFEFESLDGKVKLSARRVEGHTTDEPRRTCRPRPQEVIFEGAESAAARPVAGRPTLSEAKGEGFVADFSALAHLGGRTIEIYAIKLAGEIVPDMAATSTRRYGRVLLSTTVHAPETEEESPGEAARFSIVGKGTRPRGATLSAPAPFSGTATYAYRPGSRPTFLGDLAVRIPGEGTLPLAGPGFRAALCNFAKTRKQRACEATVGTPHTV